MRQSILFSMLMVVFLLVCANVLATTVSVGTVSLSTPNVPFNAQYDYSYAQSLYKASQIGMSGTITAFRLYYAGNGSLNGANNWTIYMGNTTKYSFGSTTDWVPYSSLTQVYTGTVTLPAAGNWVTFNLSTPFQYDNTKDLVIAYDENSAGWPAPVAYWGYYNPGEPTRYCNMAIGTMDNSNPDPAAPPTANARAAYQAGIQLDITPHTYQLSVNTNVTGTIAGGGSAAIGQNTPWMSSTLSSTSSLIGTYTMMPLSGGTWDPSSIVVSAGDFVTAKDGRALLSKTINFTWTADPVYTITLSSIPTGAMIYKDGVELGIEPQIVNPAATGTYTAVLTNYNFTPYEVTGSITSNLVHEFTGTFAYDIPADVPTALDGVSITASLNLNYDPPSPAQNDIVLALQNYDNLNSSMVTVLSGVGLGSFTITVSSSGMWYGLVYYNGVWHQSSPYSVDVVPPAQGIFTFDDVDFGAKGDVIVFLGEGENPTLPVTLSSFTAMQNSASLVSLVWISQSETEMLGYKVFRNSAADLATAEAVSGIIPATNTSNETTYQYTDQEVETNLTYYYWLQSMEINQNGGFHGPVCITVTGDDDQNPHPDVTACTRIKNVYPNPFNPNTLISYFQEKSAKTEITVYNLKGQIITCLENEFRTAGDYQIRWNGKDAQGQDCSSGAYYVLMKTDNKRYSKKIILLK